MAVPTQVKSPYERRVELVKDTIRDRSKLDDSTAGELAVHVLHVLDSIPEKMR
jgi:Family of unknown function (DUF6307)